MKESLLVIFAYFIGSFPTAVIVSKAFFGIDIRDYGSGNMGATNTFRVLGARYGALVMIIDVLKGVIAASLFHLLPYYLTNEMGRINFMLALGIAAVIGHLYPVWADFKGGKGVATLLGVVLAIQPIVALSCIGVFLIVLYLTRYVSLSSIIAGIALPVCVLIVYNVPEVFYRIFAIAVAALILLTHQKNIGRLLKGEEGRMPILKRRDRRKSRRNSE